MADLPACIVVEGQVVERPRFLGISINVSMSRRAVVIDPPCREVDESALSGPGLVPVVKVPDRLPRVVMVPVVDKVEVASGLLEG